MNTPPRQRTVVLAAWMYAHHNPSSGYGQLCRFIDATCIKSTDSALARAPEGSLRWQVGRKWFDARILAAAQRADLVHFLYAENHLRLLFAAVRRLRVAGVGTLHLPLNNYSLQRAVAALRQLDGIITLTSAQADEVRSHLPQKIVRFIPHGFVADHPYRNLGAHRETPSFRVAVIGSNYRDWTTLSSVMRRAAEDRPDWRFHLVGLPAARRPEFARFPNAVVHDRLAEPDYYEVLNRAHVLFMPVTFATANNALLEAHSVGLPALCSDLPAVRDYAVSTTRFMRTGDEALDVLDTLARQSPGDRERERAATVAGGTAFSWTEIAPRIQAFYGEVNP